ncbi:MAG TPA: hypothetical protein VJZ77_01195 [Blastocatellia bacterium]|nr:hypothetical protein [Blastocatellia bacterium]
MSNEDKNQDKDKQKSPSRFFSVAPLIIGMSFGGLGGAVFTYWMNRPQSTVLAYNLTSVVIANPAASDVIPNLSCRIGDEPVSLLYSNVIEFTPVEGPYLESAEVAIRYPESTKFFGVTAQSPSPLHQFDCKQRGADIICSATKLSSREKTAYRVKLATSGPQSPSLTVAGKDLELADLNTYVERQSARDKSIYALIANLVFISITVIAMQIFWVKFKRRVETEMKKILERRDER